MDTRKVNYIVNDLYFALENLIMTNIRMVIDGILFDKILSNRELMNANSLLSVLSDATELWG